jgi:hypothetical protein
MEFEPPRAKKKYSRSLESGLDRIANGMEKRAPEFLKPSFLRAYGPALAAAGLSLLPGLGTWHLSKKFQLPLIQFGIWSVFFLLHLLVLGSFWGWCLTLVMISYHQYLLYRAYLEGLRKTGTPLPEPLQATFISALLSLMLFGLYLIFSILTWDGLLSFRD